MQWKTEVGGWWNLAVGKRPPQLKTQDSAGPGMAWNGSPKSSSGWGRAPKGSGKKGKGQVDSVEEKINALAEALGVPSNELAYAIAGAVREYVPPASLSSIKARETGGAVEELIKGASGENPKVNEAKASSGSASGVVGGVESALEGFVGMDEP